MLVSEVASRVKRQFGDEVGAQITDADIIRWVNDSQREIAVYNDLLQTVATTAIVAGRDQYTLPPDVLTVRSVRLAGLKLSFLSQNETSNFISTTTAGTPTHYSIWALKMDLFPTPTTADPDDIQIYYTRQPAVVTAVTDTPELPLQYHNRIVEYCIAQAHELDDDMQSYQSKMEMFSTGIDKLRGIDAGEQDVYPSVSVGLDDGGFY